VGVVVCVAVLTAGAGVSYRLTGAAEPPPAPEPRTPEPKAAAPVIAFTADGKLKRPPADYRKWVYIGTPLTVDDGDATFEAVYMNPDSFAHYEKTGTLPDGTVLVKELVGVGATEGVSGKGYFMGEYTGLEVAIKDATRFKDEPGNWAYFLFGKAYPLKGEASKQATAACNECHQKHAKTDWVFSQYYPVLRAATPRAK
jgi:hypothetical protein